MQVKSSFHYSLYDKCRYTEPHVCTFIRIQGLGCVYGLCGVCQPQFTRVILYCNHVDLQIRGVEYHYFIYICSSTGRDIMLGVLYGYKALLQVATVVMALKTRKVKVQGLDDYREIVMATYFTCFVLVIILIVNYTVEDQINTFTAVTSLSIFIGTTAIVVLVFVPKVTYRVAN